MSKKIQTILLSVAMLAISIVLLLVFVFTQKPNKEKPLSITASEIHLNEGEFAYSFYSISHPNTEVSFDVDCDNVIEIDSEHIKAIKAGVAQVTITAKLNKKIAQTTFKVYVYKNTYSFTLDAQSNCTFNENTLTMTGGICQFKVSVYDKLGQIVQGLACNYNATNNAVLNYEFNVFQLSSTTDCEIKLIYEEISFEITINVKTN